MSCPSPSGRVDLAILIFGSTEFELTGRPVPLSGLVRLRTLGPLRNSDGLSRTSSGSYPILPAAIPLRRCPIIRNSEVSFPLHSKRFHKMVARINSGFIFLYFYLDLLPFCSHSLRQQSLNNPCTRSAKRKVTKKYCKKFSLGVCKIQEWRRNPFPAPYSALNRGSKSLT